MTLWRRSSCAASAMRPRVFNIGNPRSAITNHELAKLVKRIAASDSPVRFVDNPEVDVDFRVPDISRARSLLGFEPKVDLDEGIARTLAAFRETSPIARSTLGPHSLYGGWHSKGAEMTVID